MISELEYDTNEVRFPFVVHLLSAFVAVAFSIVMIATTHPYSFLAAFMIYLLSVTGVPLIPVLIWMVRQ